jgi:hypothetical protein
MVAAIPNKTAPRLLSIIALWLQVIVTPEDNKIIVLTKGKLHGSKVIICLGGQIEPISIDAFKLQCKKAQKKELKNITSDKINKMNPNRIPFWTARVWNPSKVLSTTTSVNQRIKKKVNTNNDKRT